MTRRPYKNFLKLKEKGENDAVKKYLQEVLKEQEKKRETKGYDLPKNWVTLWDVNNIFAGTYTNVKYGRKYRRVQAYYKKYGDFQKPIIISKNKFLLDGFNQLLFARKKRIREIPAIMLDNVIVIN